MNKLILFTLSCVFVLVGEVKADVSEIVLSDCFSDIGNNLGNRLTSKGNKFIANKNSNSLVEINLDLNKSNTWSLMNFNSEYAEAGEIKKAMSNGKHVADAITNVKMFYQTKIVKIKYTTKWLYENGRKLEDNEAKLEEGPTWTYTCSSRNIFK